VGIGYGYAPVPGWKRPARAAWCFPAGTPAGSARWPSSNSLLNQLIRRRILIECRSIAEIAVLRNLVPVGDSEGVVDRQAQRRSTSPGSAVFR